MDSNKAFSDKLFYFPVIVLGIYFIIRLVNQSQMLWAFPLDSKNDVPTYLAFLYWFKVYGFHGYVPHWLNGFVLFDVYPPGWIFFTYPIYLVTNNLLYATYISLILMFILGAIVIYFWGKSEGFGLAKALAFYFLFFVSPMAVGDFIKQGRMPEMLAWIFFLALSAIVFHYRDKIVNWNFVWCAPLFAGLVITHQVETLLFSFVVLGLLLTRKNLKEIGIIISTFIFGLGLSSFWLIGFLQKSSETTILNVNFGKWLLDFSRGFQLANIALVILPIVLLVLFYFYWRSYHFSKRELLFFSPALILSILVLFRLTLFIPLLNSVYPDPYQLFMLLFIVYFLLKIKYQLFSKKIKFLACIGLVILPLAFVAISILHTSWFVPHTSQAKEALSILPEIDGKYIALGPFPLDEVYHASIDSYAAIYYGIDTSSGLNYVQANPGHWSNILKLGQSVIAKDCNNINSLLLKTNTTNVMAYEDTCDLMEACGLYKKVKKEHFCIYKTRQ